MILIAKIFFLFIIIPSISMKRDDVHLITQNRKGDFIQFDNYLEFGIFSN